MVVGGGGNTAVQEALYLSDLDSKVTVVHRRDRFRAESILQDRLLSKTNVHIMWNNVIDEVIGEREPRKSVTGVRIRDVNTGDVREPAHTRPFPRHRSRSSNRVVSRSAGHGPGRLHQGWFLVDEDSRSGGSRRRRCYRPMFRQAISAAGMGSMAALEAEKFLAEPIETPVETREIELLGVYG